MRLFLASSYAFSARARRLVAGEGLAGTLFAVLAAIVLVRALVAGIHVLDAATAGLADRALRIREGTGIALFAGVVALRGLFGIRLGLGLPIDRYLHLPFRFTSVYRAHLLWSLIGWALLLVPLFDWLVDGLTPGAERHVVVQGLCWMAVVLFVLTTNATAEAVGNGIAMRFHRAWVWVLAAAAGLALVTLAGRELVEPLRGGPFAALLRGTPPGSLAAVLGARAAGDAAWPLLRLLGYTFILAWVATASGRRLYLNPDEEADDVAGSGERTVFLRLWLAMRRLGVPTGIAALGAREALLFVRARRLRFICATAVILTGVYGLRPEGMSALTLTVVVCFPLALLTAVFNNAFGFDRGGALGYLALPIPASRVLLAKGLVFGGVTLVVTLVGGIPVIYGLGPGVAGAAVPFSVMFAFLLFGFLAAGNFISVAFPKSISRQSLFGWLNPVASVPVALGFSALLIGVPAWAWFGGRREEFLLLMSLSAVAALAAWLWSLSAAGAWLRRRGPLL